MKVRRMFQFAVAAGLALAATSARSFAEGKMPAPAAIAKVEAAPFQLKQVVTQKINDNTSKSLYRGETVLTVTPVSAASYTIPVVVHLSTMTSLNTAGDGLTDGVLTLSSPAQHQVISGPMVAVNENFGELTGVLDGRAFGQQNAQARLRAVFHGVFQQDADGNWTLVNVDAHGILMTPATPRPAIPGHK